MDLRERTRRREQAQRSFTRAAALSLELDTDSLTSALLFAAMGIVHLAGSDPEEKMLERAQAILARCRGEKA